MKELVELLAFDERRVYKREVPDTVLSVGDVDVLVSVTVMDVRVLGCRHSLVHCMAGRKCYLTLVTCSYTVFEKLSFGRGEQRCYFQDNAMFINEAGVYKQPLRANSGCTTCTSTAQARTSKFFYWEDVKSRHCRASAA